MYKKQNRDKQKDIRVVSLKESLHVPKSNMVCGIYILED